MWVQSEQEARITARICCTTAKSNRYVHVEREWRELMSSGTRGIAGRTESGITKGATSYCDDSV